MAKVSIGADEFWPFPVLNEKHGTEVEVLAGTLKRWKRVIAEFEAVVEEIWDLMEEQTEKI